VLPLNEVKALALRARESVAVNASVSPDCEAFESKPAPAAAQANGPRSGRGYNASSLFLAALRASPSSPAASAAV
jgi:hypothetical protein